jgi:hypothetical protein
VYLVQILVRNSTEKRVEISKHIFIGVFLGKTCSLFSGKKLTATTIIEHVIHPKKTKVA